MMLGQHQSEEQLKIVQKKYGFDQPVFNQYIFYLNDLSPVSLHSRSSENYTFPAEGKYTGKSIFKFQNYQLYLKIPYLRESFQRSGKSVTSIIGETLPNTLVLAVSAMIIALITGLFLGIISAIYQDKFLDKIIQVISTLGMSVPSFFSAIIFAWLFGYVLHHYTHLDMTGSLFALDDYGEKYNLRLKNLILPALVLGIRPVAVVTQLMRNSLLEVIQQDYIRTAKAKGLSKFKILYRHALKNSLNPVITAASGWFASMLAGAVFVEYIFGWNGLGKEIVEALNTLDLPVIMGSVLIIAIMFILINIFVDIIYVKLDPKVKQIK